jgi:protein TonB
MSTAYLPQRNLDRISWSGSFAVLLHLCVLLGIGFIIEPPPAARSSLEITLASQQTSSKPEQADFLAQQDQAGSGTLEEARELTTTAIPQPQSSDISDPAAAQQQAAQERHAPSMSAVKTTRDADTQQTLDETATPPVTAEGDTLDRSSEQASIDSMQATLDRQRQIYSRRPRVHRITSVATRKSDDARYQLAWQKQVEQVGNQHYPEQARQQQLSGDVRLVVAILPDGSIQDIIVLVSSGQSVLDNAAIRSVRLAAPFAPFPDSLRSKADILEIIRTWQFRNNVLTSS